VAHMQCTYSLYKRVINILSSITIDEEVDFGLMDNAFKLLVERNDCLRIRFFKKNGNLMQYFSDSVKNIKKVPVLSFETKEQQDAFIDKVRKKPIDYMHGVVIEPYFIHTFDNRYMIFFKICHLVIDLYGINVLYTDLINVYNALKKGETLPPAPESFEEIIKTDIEKSSNGNLEEKHLEYFTDLLTNNPEPFYAGIHGLDNPIWQKQLKKHHRSMPIFLVHNSTKTYRHKIGKDLVEKMLTYCQNNQCSPANLLFYASSVASAKLNANLKNIIPIGLYNCRNSVQEKHCAGIKVQSAACYTKIDYNLSFEENLKAFSIAQIGLYRHVKFKDRDFEALMHNIYRSSPLLIYYSIAYSLLSVDMPEGVEFNLYTNGNSALPAYVIQVLDAKTKEVDMAYDVQTKITSEEDVSNFHTYYLNVLKQVLDDPDIKVSDIQLSL
jgi:hypothetical protein